MTQYVVYEEKTAGEARALVPFGDGEPVEASGDMQAIRKKIPNTQTGDFYAIPTRSLRLRKRRAVKRKRVEHKTVDVEEIGWA